MMILILTHALVKSVWDFLYIYQILILCVADILISYFYSLLISVVYFVENESKKLTRLPLQESTLFIFVNKDWVIYFIFLLGIFKSCIPDSTWTRTSSSSLVLLELVHLSKR